MRKGKAWEMIRRNRGALKSKGLHLLKVLQSEITHQLTSPCFQNDQSDPPKDFTLEWDAPNSQDVVLRKKCDTGEEVAVSALLSSEYAPEGSTYPRVVTMKVCIKKPGLSSFLKFDCGVHNCGYGPEFWITSAHHLPSTSSVGRKYYRGPSFSELDPNLQAALDDYLEAKGIGETLQNFLLHHLHKKEEAQYLNWLQRLQKMV